MSYDEFFTDGDKPYAENLNDSLALLDAFDVTVPCSMPEMFSNGEFNSTVNVTRKCGVALVTLRSVDSGVTVGTGSISGTGSVVFRVYPNFNSFYKWSKIILEKTGTVSISFRKTDGTEISATVGSDGTISESSALKQLQEIDVVFTLTSANISNILIWFINNQSERTRTGALLEASQLANVDGQVVSGETKAVNGDTVYAALEDFSTNVVDDKIDDLSDEVDQKLLLKENVSNKVNSLSNSSTNYPTCNAVKSVTDGKANSSHTHIVSEVTDWLNKVYPIGSIYMSVNNTDPSTLFGGTWQQLTDTFLYATSTTADDNVTTAPSGQGSKDAVVVEHNHTQASHNHAPSSANYQFVITTGNISAGTKARKLPDTQTDGYYFVANDAGVTIGENGVTNSKQPTINNSGESGTNKNMPPYMKVYMWKRTA